MNLTARIETLSELAKRLEGVQNVTILTHARPDGDCMGAGFGLCYFLRSRGVRANILNADGFPARFSFLHEGYEPQEFDEECVISVDVASTQLLGEGLSQYADKVDICIDHHFSNKLFAKHNYVDGSASAACLLVYEVIKLMGGEIDPLIASCLYTGIATDTGCFMYENTTPAAHRAAAELIERGARSTEINRLMFQVKSRGRLFAEQELVSSMLFGKENRVSLITITSKIMQRYGIELSELDCFAGIPLSVEGVEIGITAKQQPDDPENFRVSIRTVSVDASAIAAEFGGGGHIRAAGCSIRGTAGEVAQKVISCAERYL